MQKLTIAQQRLRLLALLAAEEAKGLALAEQLERQPADGSASPEAIALYQTLCEQQARIIAATQAKITRLTDQLEGPALREQLHQTTDQLQTAQAQSRQFQAQLTQSQAELAQCRAEVKLLQREIHDLDQLNEAYVRQISELSIHKRQNDEDHAYAVLTISKTLAQQGLRIPARASQGVESGAAPWPGCATDDLADPEIDQTLFAQHFTHQETPMTLSLVVNSLYSGTPETMAAIELVQRRAAEPRQVIEAFTLSEAVLAAERFAQMYRQLQD